MVVDYFHWVTYQFFLWFVQNTQVFIELWTKEKKMSLFFTLLNSSKNKYNATILAKQSRNSRKNEIFLSAHRNSNSSNITETRMYINDEARSKLYNFFFLQFSSGALCMSDEEIRGGEKWIEIEDNGRRRDRSIDYSEVESYRRLYCGKKEKKKILVRQNICEEFLYRRPREGLEISRWMKFSS